jgi:hypothetical protein
LSCRVHRGPTVVPVRVWLLSSGDRVSASGWGEVVSQGERVKRLVRVVVRDDLRLGTRYVVLRNLVIEARGLGS